MRVGTKSVLFGAHCFLIHPWFVAWSWWKLYGFPWDPRLWVAFFVHDLGYIGKPNMDGPEGEQHPVLGARIMGTLFGRKWAEFSLLHSRYFAKKLEMPFSKLCVADKLAVCSEPFWLYYVRVRASGEIYEYLENAKKSESGHFKAKNYTLDSAREWREALVDYMLKWVDAHKDGAEDTWTKVRHAS
mgnify:FL=1